MNRHQRRRQAALNRGRQPGYIHRILAAQRNGALAPTPGVHFTTIEHDAGCGIYRGGCCDCVPDISVADGVTVIDERGGVSRTSRQ